MKKIYLIILLVTSGLLTSAQKTLIKHSDVSMPYYSESRNIEVPFYLQPNYTVSDRTSHTETVIGTTYWDLQSSNSAPPNRFHVYDDGTMAAVWTFGNETETNYLDRGTGYAFFNGTSWDSVPETRIETERTGWPSYAPAGNGEIIAAHHNSMGITINWREERGTGDWNEYIVPNPVEGTFLSWPRLVSSGDDHMTVHMLTNTYEPYDSLNSAILYYRSTDGGVSWETEARILEGMSSTEYSGLDSETYAWAEPKDSMLAFVVADRWSDLFIMRSNDNGDTWEKTVVWEHPYPMWNQTLTDTFYSPDGAASIAFDNDGMLHLAFGVSRTMFMEDTTGTTPGIVSWFPFVDGVAYWNENMPAWSGGSMQALNPDSLDLAGNLIGSVQDMNADGVLDLVGTNYQNIGLYYVGLSSMPQLSIDEEDRIFLVYSGIAEGVDDGTQNFRHLWARFSEDSGDSWSESVDLTGDSAQVMNESVFPTLASWSGDGNLHLIYQSDTEPGMSTLGDMDSPTLNSIVYMQIPKAVIISTSDAPAAGFRISQNYPNPFSDYTNFSIDLDRPSKVSLNIYDITGRLVISLPEKNYPSGQYLIPLNAQNLTKGVYTYTFIINGYTNSNKMIVK